MARAQMGFVGYLKLIPQSGADIGIPTVIRATSADIKLTQEINPVDVVDGKIDQTVYQLGPQVVGGNVSFPLIHEISGIKGNTGFPCTSNAVSLAERIWKFATLRDRYGRMSPECVFQCAIRYSDNLGYIYNGCIINTLSYTITKGEPVNGTCELIGGVGLGTDELRVKFDGNTNIGSGYNPDNSDALSFLGPARVITWNDVGVGVWSGDNETGTSATGIELVDFHSITEFSCNINNNVERIYSLNGRLAPVDVVAKKREITGTLKMLGHQHHLSDYTITNQNRFTSGASIAFGYKLGNENDYYWATGLYGVVFQIEEVTLSNGLFETNTNWRALGDCENNHLSTRLGARVAGNLVKPQNSGNTYGNSTAPSYPYFSYYGEDPRNVP